jgi:lipoyl(octanoyl) transferase
MARELRVTDLKQMDYLEALAVQEKILEEKTRQTMVDVLLLAEHPHVFTMGRRDARQHALGVGEIPLYPTSRGGDITYHGPGQLVVYPIVDLKSRFRRDVHAYLRKLEQAIIDSLSSFGLSAMRRPPWTGVWIGNSKICAIGIAVRRGITYHGAALNVAPDLTYFQKIVPCGLEWARVTSMDNELYKRVEMDDVKAAFIAHFCRRFDYMPRVDQREHGGEI